MRFILKTQNTHKTQNCVFFFKCKTQKRFMRFFLKGCFFENFHKIY